MGRTFLFEDFLIHFTSKERYIENMNDLAKKIVLENEKYDPQKRLYVGVAEMVLGKKYKWTFFFDEPFDKAIPPSKVEALKSHD